MNESHADLYTETIHQFLKLHRYLRKYARQVRAEGISGRKISALRYLLESGPRTVGQMSAYHDISDSSASEMVDQFEALGYATRSRSKTDNRVVLVSLTETGRAFAQEAPLGGIPLMREKLKTLSPERLSTIGSVLTDLIELLEIDNDD